MGEEIRGKFEVQLSAAEGDADPAADSGIGRMLIDKRFHGELEGTSKGQMLSFRSETPGSAGYVAMERVTGSLAGQSGAFTLQHSSTMSRGEPSQSIIVVPDSGTGELAGLTGEMTIDIVDGEHFYNFEYALPADAE